MEHSNQYPKRTCHIHGDYIPFGSVFGRSLGAECPACEREKVIKFMVDRSGLSKRYLSATFESYQATTNEQRIALAAARDFTAKVLDGDDGHLLMLGMPGTGKTHLGCAIALAAMNGGKRAWYATARDVIREIRSTWNRSSEKTEVQIVNGFAEVPLLVLDEIGGQVGSDAEIASLFDVLDGRYANQLPSVVISNLGMEDLKAHLGARLIDRLRHHGKVITMTGESHRKAA